MIYGLIVQLRLLMYKLSSTIRIKYSPRASLINNLPCLPPDVAGNYYRIDRKEGSYPPRDVKEIRP